MKKTTQRESELNFIGHTTSIEGNIVSDGDLHINGKIKGKIRCSGSISLGDEGAIDGEVYAENAIIGGMIQGKIVVKNKVTLESKSSLVGELTCARLVIEEGANFDGSSSMGKKSPVDPAKANNETK
jgi:cytoskeletal protein CcmA (bactofilin family)